MIKPILYHSFEDKKRIAEELLKDVSHEERLARWNALAATVSTDSTRAAAHSKRSKKTK